jgi:hypothetical protein
MTELHKEAEFIFDGFVHGDVCSIVGRCGDFPIRVGDVFDAVMRYKPRRTADELATPPEREIEIPASIRVVGVQAYGRSLKCLGEGMTGSLTVEGEGLEHLAPGWILGRRSEPLNGVAHETSSVHVAAARRV